MGDATHGSALTFNKNEEIVYSRRKAKYSEKKGVKVNKAHAAAYSVTSYMTAWLKYHYPAEFFAAVLNYVGKIDEIPSIIADAKRHNVRVLRPDINKSDVNFTVENGNVRFGLAFLRGAKSRAQSIVDNRESSYGSFKEFVASKPGKAIAEACIMSGACDSYIKQKPELRSGLMVAYTELDKLNLNMEKAIEKVNTATNDTQRQEAKKALSEIEANISGYTFPKVEPLPMIERLQKERYFTSVYFSGNPLDNYNIVGKKYTNIDDLNVGDSKWVVGTISEEEILKTKRDARQMMSGKLTDYTGTVNFIVFPQAYEEYAELLAHGTVAMRGNYTLKDNEEEAQFVVNEVQPLQQKVSDSKIVVWFEPDQYNAIKQIIANGKNENGLECFMVGRNSKMYKAGRITEQYAQENNLKYEIQN